MPPRPFRLGRARTGLGLFATRPIKKNLRIAEYKGKLLPLKEAEAAEARGNRYLYEVTKKWTIDGKDRGNIARYFNHSCNPNTESYSIGKRVFVRTIKPIKPGDELVYDYGSDYLNNVIGKSRCQCPRCRKRRAKRAKELRLLRLRREARLAARKKKERAAKRKTKKKA
ncbi:MAG: SET domain-containing protein [Bradyrhizobium sp.]|nr:SET domain-containing protein [Bradyrhizobium sp.]